MRIRRFTSSVVSQVLLGLALPVAIASAAVVDGDDLARNSPFLPEDYVPQQEQRRPPPPPPPPPPRGPQPLDQLEFRGMTTFGGKTEFSLFDPSQKRSFWIGIGQSGGGFQVAEFNERDQAIVVKHDGRTRTISLKESQVEALPAAAPPAAPREGQRQRETAAQPQDQEERMKNLQEEIRRRREVRRALVEEAESNQPPQSRGTVVRPAAPSR